jgi:hypothetical protein
VRSRPKVIGLLLASVVLFFLAGSLFSAATSRKHRDRPKTTPTTASNAASGS